MADSLKTVLQKGTLADTIRVKLFNDLAFAYYNINDFENAKAWSGKAIALAIQIKYPKGEGNAYRRLSSVYMKDNANPLTLYYLSKAYKVFKALNDELNSARVLTNIGLFYYTIKEYELSRAYFSQALQIADKLKRYSLKILLLNNIGDIYETTGQIKKAHANYSEALSLALRTNDGDYIYISNLNLASIFLKQGKYKLALACCDTVIAAADKGGKVSPKDMAEVYLIQGRVYKALKNYAKARQLLLKSDVLIRQTHDVGDKVQIYREYYLIDSAQGKYQSALTNYYRYNRLNDSLVNVDKNHVVAFYNMKFKSQKQEDEIQRLQIAEEKNKAIIGQQHTIQWALSIGLVLICCGLFYLNHINKQVKAKNAIIHEQNRALEGNNRVKDKLFSVISHDMRSPVTQVIGLFNLWESGQMDHQEMKALTPTVKEGFINLLDLMDNLLVWSQKQLQGFNYTPELFNVHVLCIENIQSLQNNIVQKQLRIQNNVTAETTLLADREMIKIVIRNLVANAVKFTPAGGLITIESYIEDNWLVIAVRDTGIGINATDQQKIFSFTTHTTLGTANEKGTGMGLKICRDFVEINKGKIWVDSQENAGSAFFVAFPA